MSNSYLSVNQLVSYNLLTLYSISANGGAHVGVYLPSVPLDIHRLPPFIKSNSNCRFIYLRRKLNAVVICVVLCYGRLLKMVQFP